MTAPGGAGGEGHRDDGVNPPPSGGPGPQQPAWDTPWELPGAPPPAGYPPPGYPSPSFDYQSPPPGYGGPAPGGYGPPTPYPGGYYPAPDYPGGYGFQPAQPGMNRMAIGSLIASFTGLFCCIGGIVGIVLGIIALDQIKRTRQDGYAMAVAGIVIGIATLIIALIVGIFAMHSS